MIRFFFFIALLLQPLTGALTFESNYQHESVVLKSLDIDPSFLNDKILIQTIEAYKETYRNRHFFKTMDEAYLYIPMIKSILSRSDLPGEFLFLAMVESNFSTRAFSNKRAAGLWQFMPQTAERQGLRIDDYVDERRDLVKSTQAAVDYLGDLHKRFGKWYLAAMAYNCGEGRLNRAIERAGTDDLSVLLNSKKRYIPLETRLYIRKILALALMGSDENYLITREYDFLLNRATAFSIVPVEIASGERLSRIAKTLQLPVKELEKYNRHLNYDFVPPYGKTYTIYIPYAKLTDFKRDYKPEPLRNIYMIHTVKAGDNLSKIGKRYGVSYKKIMDFNRLEKTNLSLKQRLIIPVDKPAVDSEMRYVVQSGDTLISIAKSFEISVDKLMAMNNLKNSFIRIGDRLNVYD